MIAWKVLKLAKRLHEQLQASRFLFTIQNLLQATDVKLAEGFSKTPLFRNVRSWVWGAVGSIPTDPSSMDLGPLASFVHPRNGEE